MNTRRFKIRWTNKKTGREITTDYTFDGLGNQRGHSFGSWIMEICWHNRINKTDGWDPNHFDLLTEQYPDMTEAELDEIV